jgi:hypothetical protein
MFDSSSLTLLALFLGPIHWQVFQNRKKRKGGKQSPSLYPGFGSYKDLSVE